MEKGGPGSRVLSASGWNEVITGMSDLHIKVVDAPHVTQLLDQDLYQEYRDVCFVMYLYHLDYLYLYIQIYETLEVKNLPSMLHYVSICWRAWVLG